MNPSGFMLHVVLLNVAQLTSWAVSGYARKHANTIGHSVVGDSQMSKVDFKGKRTETRVFGIYIIDINDTCVTV